MNEFLSNVNNWLGYLLAIVSLVGTFVASIMAIKDKKFGKVQELAIEFIKQAESLKSKNGDSVAGSVKKEVVLAKVQTACKNFGLKYDETIWSTIIDNYVDLTLRVNQRAQDKQKIALADAKTTTAVTSTKA